MTGYIKKPHIFIFIGQTGREKTHLVLVLIEKQHHKHFDYIVIICTTYHAKGWIKNDDSVWLVDSKDNLYQWTKKSELLRFLEVLSIIDDVVANEGLDKKRQPH